VWRSFIGQERVRGERGAKGDQWPVMSGPLLMSSRVGEGKRRDRGDGRAAAPCGSGGAGTGRQLRLT
jgi:hypothetical protein